MGRLSLLDARAAGLAERSARGASQSTRPVSRVVRRELAIAPPFCTRPSAGSWREVARSPPPVARAPSPSRRRGRWSDPRASTRAIGGARGEHGGPRRGAQSRRAEALFNVAKSERACPCGLCRAKILLLAETAVAPRGRLSLLDPRAVGLAERSARGAPKSTRLRLPRRCAEGIGDRATFLRTPLRCELWREVARTPPPRVDSHRAYCTPTGAA